MHTVRPRHLLAPVLALALAAALPARAAGDPIAYRYTQTGFADNATVNGWFVGQDEDGDGWLYAYELSDFSFSFSGNGAVASFTMGMDNRAGLEFDIAAAELQHLAVVGPGDARDLEYDAFGWPGYDIPGRVTDNLQGLISISWDRLQVEAISPVPEPGQASLWLGGLLALATMTRRRLGANPGARPT